MSTERIQDRGEREIFTSCKKSVDTMGIGLVTAGVGTAVWRALLEERLREGYQGADKSLD